jgi:hypothetical protein
LEIEFDGEIAPDKIVVRGYLSTDNGVEATVQKSLPINDTQGSTILDSAEVWLYEDDQALTQLLPIDTIQYVTPDSVSLNELSDYKLVVKATGFETAISNSEKTLPKVEIDSIYWNYDTIYWIGNFYVSFIDPTPDVINYYHVVCNLYIEDAAKCTTIWEDLEDDGYSSTKRTFHDNYYGHLDSALVTIYNYSSTIISFSDSYSDYEGSYSDIMYDNIYCVENYVENGYGFFGAREITTTMFYRE